MKKNKKEKSKVKIGSLLPGFLLGVLIGFFMIFYVDKRNAPDNEIEWIAIGAELITLYVSVFAHSIIHEAGHLVCGLLSGYRFSSFRIFSWMWVKENGKIKRKRMSIAGTGGQCLMIPPDPIDGKFPTVLYNLGGSLANLIVSAISIAVAVLFYDYAYISPIAMVFALFGVVLALLNGIPMRSGGVDNDGRNAWSLRKNPTARRAFWLQLKINEQIASGVRLKDMPSEWFEFPTDEEMQNNLIAAIGVFACNRLMDERRFEEAEEKMTHLLDFENGVNRIHACLMVCDLIYLELIGENRPDVIESMLTKEQRQFMKAMKTFPTVLRTQYAMKLLGDKDAYAAERIRLDFEKHGKKYPYPNELAAERELLDIAADHQ